MTSLKVRINFNYYKMKELLQSLFSTSKERISNPLIGTFIFSWVAFNWKSILFLFFSSKTIEDKISFIELNFSSLNNLLLLPLVVMVIYILIIPYLNLAFEYLLEFSRVRRNKISISKLKQGIENKKELAIEEIKLEEAQTEFKERKNHNKLIEDLQRSIQDKDEQLRIERERFTDLNRKIKDESTYLNQRFHEDRKDFEDKISNLLNENRILRDNLVEKDKNLRDENDRRLFGSYSKRVSEEEGPYLTNKKGERIHIKTLTNDQINKLKSEGFI